MSRKWEAAEEAVLRAYWRANPGETPYQKCECLGDLLGRARTAIGSKARDLGLQTSHLHLAAHNATTKDIGNPAEQFRLKAPELSPRIARLMAEGLARTERRAT